MKTETIIETVEQKKTRLAKRLLEIKEHWPYSERAQWALSNGYNSESIRKLYLSGAINSIPVAEKLIEAIERYMKINNIAA
jgi:hypothetical protein